MQLGHIEIVRYLKDITKFNDVCNIVTLFCVCVYILGGVACYNSGWGYSIQYMCLFII